MNKTKNANKYNIAIEKNNIDLKLIIKNFKKEYREIKKNINSLKELKYYESSEYYHYEKTIFDKEDLYIRLQILYRYNKKNKKTINRIINGATLKIGTPYTWEEKIIYNII